MERTLINAISCAKRNVHKGYSFNELIEDIEIRYFLRKDEVKILRNKLIKYCKKNFIRLTGI